MAINDLFKEEIKVVNIGLDSFKESLDDAGYKCVQVDWSPPAGGDEEAMNALDALKGLF